MYLLCIHVSKMPLILRQFVDQLTLRGSQLTVARFDALVVTALLQFPGLGIIGQEAE